jgi:hypothetical protein
VPKSGSLKKIYKGDRRDAGGRQVKARQGRRHLLRRGGVGEEVLVRRSDHAARQDLAVVFFREEIVEKVHVTISVSWKLHELYFVVNKILVFYDSHINRTDYGTTGEQVCWKKVEVMFCRRLPCVFSLVGEMYHRNCVEQLRCRG